ncbi:MULTISPECIES: hypothetical protein [unclassified Spirillospora]|uniref:hypothetical protein n=1 Tax=unclassified Spirillospora TaxID=2642701 RepID=UPI003710A411
MSGPRDTRDSAEQAGTSAVPADSVPPSFGGAVPPADPPPADAVPPAGEAEPTASASIRLPAFGLQAPWWAAESSETAPPAEEAPAEAPVPEEASAEASDDEIVFGAGEPAADGPVGPEATGVPPGTLVAGVGVPNIDSRRAVPAEPIVKRPLADGDTDPDGFSAVQPDDGAPANAGDESPDAPEHEKTEDEAAVDDTVVKNAAEDRPSEAAPLSEATAAATAETAEPSAFEKAKQAEDASAASLGPVLEPDAILPVGVTPPTGSGPFPQAEPSEEAAVTAEQAAVIAPIYHVEGGVPLDTPPPPGGPPPATPKSGGGKRRPLLIGGGAAVILAAAVALFTIGGTDSSGDQATDVKATESPAAAKPTPADTPSPAPPIPTTGVDITNERTDTKPLAFKDVFPTGVVKLGGRTFALDRWSLNRDVSYAARGSMLQVLTQEKCRKIIRATFIDRSRSLAVTSGIAVMPTKESALRVSQAGDPARYEWFRGMGSKHNPDLDRAGGYAAATVRGRYVAYAYVQWANGKNAQPGDPVIKQAAQQFLDYDLRPIMARARG